MAYVERLLTRFSHNLANLFHLPTYVHPRYGPLARKDVVKMPQGGLFPKVSKDESLLLHLTVTGRCNARCKGCINTTLTCEGRKEVLSLFECEPERDARALAALITQKKASSATVAFYGGEPFLALSKMEAIVRRLDELSPAPEVRFMVYTNGQLLARALEESPGFFEKIWLLSVSIDGSPEQHARFRCGTDLFTIRENLALVRRRTAAKILQWSTIREGQSLLDCFLEFLSLYEAGLVDYFFWHLAETDEPFADYLSFAEDYHRDLERIFDLYLAYLSKGELLPVIPINELLVFWLTGEARGHSACGVELATNYDLVGGRVLACADLPPELALGEVSPSGEVRLNGEGLLSRLVAYRDLLGCASCGVFAYCGGRCPVQVLTGSTERTLAYCELTRLLVATLAERVEEIVSYLERHGLTPQKIYDHSAYLARYTDVIP